MPVTQGHSGFPLGGLLPKQETQALKFLKGAGFNGAGVTVAILDTGIDPLAPGLLRTPQGTPKITHLIDCTGSGDVQGTAVSVTAAPSLKGLSGKELRLNLKELHIPSGTLFIGLKNAFDLFPKSLLDRLRKEHKLKFDLKHHQLVTEAHRYSASLNSNTAAPASAEVKKEAPKEPAQQKSPIASTQQEKGKEEAKARLAVLEEQLKAYEEPPLVFDCVWFHNGTQWIVYLDVNGSGDLTGQGLLTEYHLDPLASSSVGSFGQDSLLNFTVNVYDEGRTLSIVTTSGSHGTHVGAITAAYFEDSSELNGVAPGAQLISLKIGDNRLGSMETGTGLVRAAIELCKLNPELANMSYGEASSLTDQGRFIQLLRDEYINKKNGIFVTSAGNAGPALSTVGAPGGFSSGLISVGAYVNHSMMEAEYAMLEKVQERPYTWSSRGPSLDGDVGVDIYAPGAAITSVPQYTVQNAQLMNGTSMASPNACGCIALILSALKNKQIPYTPYLIKRAIQNAGLDIQDPMGVKFIQVENAYNYLTSIASLPNYNLHYEVSVNDSGRGIYLRGVEETKKLNTFIVNVQPKFVRHDEPETNLEKVKMEAHLILKASQGWIIVPENVHLNNGGRGFGVQVDASRLHPGFHFGQILGYDSSTLEKGPLFSVPVTVCVPDTESSSSSSSAEVAASGFVKYDTVDFTPGSIIRKFIAVPSGASFAELTIKSKNRNTTARFYTHIMQLQPQTRYPRFEHDFAFGLNSTESGNDQDSPTFTKVFKVLPNVNMELCLAQFWSSLKQTTVSVELKFHSLLCSASGEVLGGFGAGSGCSDVLSLSSGVHGFTRLDVTSQLRKEDIAPSVSLDTYRKFIRPSADYLISPLESRDVLPDSKQVHQLALTYSFSIPNDCVKVVPRIPRMNEVLYESTFENFCLLVFNAHKQCLSYQDVYPKELKLNQGSYEVKVQVTSWSVSWLEKLASMPLVLDVSLSKSVSLPVYSSIIGALTGDGSLLFKKKTLQKGERVTLFVGDASSLPKEVGHGDILLGKLDLPDKLKVDAPLYKVTYHVPPESKATADKSAPAEEEKTDDVLLKEAIRDLEISWLKKAKSDDFKKTLLTRLQVEHPSYLPLHKQHLESLFTKLDKMDGDATKELSDLCAEVVVIADKIQSIIDIPSLVAYYGVRQEKESPEQKIMAKKKDAEKETLTYALMCKTFALRNLSVLSVKENIVEADALNAFEKALEAYGQWVSDSPLSNGRYLLVWSYSQQKKGYYATALKAINKYLDEPKNCKGTGDSEDAICWRKLSDLKSDLLKKLNWDLWLDYDEKWKLVKFPKEYARF